MNRVYIANFGIGNALWSRCHSISRIATYSDDDESWHMWRSADREAYMAAVMGRAQERGDPLTKPVASRWFNLLSIVQGSDDDLWIHREKDELWWARSTPAVAEFSLVPAPWPNPNTTSIHLVEKPTTPWSNVSASGVGLTWHALHPKAKHFLFTEATLQELVPDNASYARTLLAGGDLSGWHARADWNTLAARRGHGEVRSHDAWSRVGRRMAMTAEGTAYASTRGPRLQDPKFKGFHFRDVHELSEYVAALLEKQGYVCAITELPLQLDDEEGDRELQASLDRIDSDAHYEPGNLQVVCRFVNRWKSSSDDASFRRLVAIVRGQGA